MNMRTPRTKEFREGYVLCKFSTKRNRWRVQFRCKQSGRYRQLTVPAHNMDDVRRIAVEYNRHLLAQRGVVPGIRAALPSRPELSVRDALLEAIKRGSSAGEPAKADYLQSGNMFLAWLAEVHPDRPCWGDLSPGVVQEYVGTLQHLSQARIVARLKPVKLADLYWHREKPEQFRRITAAVRVTGGRAPLAPVALDAPELLAYLDGVRETRPQLWPLLALCGLGGLRVLEAAAVRPCDVDLMAGTVTVAETPIHRPKTHASHRTIPCCGLLTSILRTALEVPGQLDPAAPLCLSPTGKPWKLDTLRLTFRRLHDAMRKAGRAVPDGFTAKQLRKCAATIARRAGADSRLVEAYLGHTGASVLERHYEHVRQSDLARVSEALDRALGPVAIGAAAPVIGADEWTAIGQPTLGVEESAL